MHLMISKEIAEAIGVKKFVPFGISTEAWKTRNFGDMSIGIHLPGLARRDVKALRDLLASFVSKDTKSLVRDVEVWIAALDDAGAAKARTAKQFESILIRYIATMTERRIVYRQEGALWFPYYVNGIDVQHDREYETEWVDMDLIWEEFGRKEVKSVHFRESDFRSVKVSEALARKGYVCETASLRADHDAALVRFHDLAPRVGLQCLASGVATDDCDGNEKKRRSNSWYWSRTNKIRLDRDGAPGRVVVDVFFEEEKEDRRNGRDVSQWFWHDMKRKVDVDADPDPPVVAAPVHPVLVVFDLARHQRVRVHVGQLAEYVYDEAIAEKLILPDDTKRLVRMLVESKGGAFRDIVAGKSGGAVVLLAGPPGVGKTLTAEVYAEAERRALYSVQCSQLGVDPETIEDELLKVFARAKRWGAVMLLDEADVYVHERGSDLAQNAIVGVFLRVLEYQSTVLFLTTNRPDDVDDAIASRCVARLTYEIPSKTQQMAIWDVLSRTSGIGIAGGQIASIVVAFPRLSGRDIKNLLKLAAVVAPGKPVTREAVEFAYRFRPTLGEKVP